MQEFKRAGERKGGRETSERGGGREGGRRGRGVGREWLEGERERQALAPSFLPLSPRHLHPKRPAPASPPPPLPPPQSSLCARSERTERGREGKKRGKRKKRGEREKEREKERRGRAVLLTIKKRLKVGKHNALWGNTEEGEGESGGEGGGKKEENFHI